MFEMGPHQTDEIFEAIVTLLFNAVNPADCIHRSIRHGVLAISLLHQVRHCLMRCAGHTSDAFFSGTDGPALSVL
jgi:hypothetical protein